MTRRRWISLGLLALLILVVGVFFTVRDTTTPVEAADIHSAGGVVYVYDTTGFQEISALGGARHDYPPQSYVTVTPGGCGSVVRWQVLEERWMEWDRCTGDPSPVSYDDFNEWFGVSEWGVFECTPAGGSPSMDEGASWSVECASPDTHEQYRFLVVGEEIVDVGGEAVETVHVRSVSEASGMTTGRSETDEWIRPSDGLLVRRTMIDDSHSATSVGDVVYHEEYDIVLSSLEPARSE